MPEIGDVTYMIAHFSECGQSSSNGFSIQPVQCDEIMSYSKMSGIGNWESVLIHSMSRMYVNAKYMFDDVLCECPYRYEDMPMLELQLLASRAVVKQKVEE